MARRTTWLIDMGDGTWAVSCMACRIAIYRGPKAGADRAARTHSCEPVHPPRPPPPTTGLTTWPTRAPVRRRDPGPTCWTDAPPTANQSIPHVKEQHMHARNGWSQPPGWGPPHQTGWAPLVDHGPLPLQTARSVGRWLWPTMAVSGFVLVTGFVLGHDDPAPGLSLRGLCTIALAAAVIILLTLRRTAGPGPGPLARALFEYAVVFLLAVLVATTGINLDAAATGGKQASNLPDQRPALVKTIDGFRDWLSQWRDWARSERDRRDQAAPTTLDRSRVLAPSPGPSASTRSPL